MPGMPPEERNVAVAMERGVTTAAVGLRGPSPPLPDKRSDLLVALYLVMDTDLLILLDIC
jgi:hypothetical protein